MVNIARGRTLALTAALLLTTASPASAAPDPYPVPYSYLASSVTAGMKYGASPPGTNEWSCRPTEIHPRPVVLVHGLAENQNTNWQTYGPLLANHGFCVFALTYGVAPGAGPGLDQLGGMREMEDSAHELAAFVNRVRRTTRAGKVDLVAHSEGTLLSGYYLKFLGGGAQVRHLVSLAPLWHGSTGQVDVLTDTVASVVGPEFSHGELPVCSACSQLSPRSPFMTRLRAGGVAVPGVDYTNLVTKYDEFVIPYTSGIESGMRNVVLQDRCTTDLSDHLQIAASPVAAAIALETLGARTPPVCRVVLPVAGTP